MSLALMRNIVAFATKSSLITLSQDFGRSFSVGLMEGKMSKFEKILTSGVLQTRPCMVWLVDAATGRLHLHWQATLPL